MTAKTKMLFIFGLGYTGAALADVARAAGFSVGGVGRAGFHDVSGEALAQATHIFSTIPPAPEGDPVLARYGNCISHQWLGYCSTTGVYGDYAGAWVDEGSALKGTTPRLLQRIAAEEAWRTQGAHVFRLAGIYGPGRSVLGEVLAGTARRIDKPGQVFSRIHVEDIAGVVLASMQAPAPGEIYNVCDDVPAPSHEVVAHACALLGKGVPPLTPYASEELSSMAQEFYAANRRVSNRKIKETLGYRLRFPSYREGLADVAQKLQNSEA